MSIFYIRKLKNSNIQFATDVFWSLSSDIVNAVECSDVLDKRLLYSLIGEYKYLERLENETFNNIKDLHNEQLVGYYLIDRVDIIYDGGFIISVNLKGYEPIWVYALNLIDKIEFIDYSIIERDINFGKLYE